MLRSMLKSKIHRATVIDAELHYEGSLAVDAELMAAVGLIPFEQVHVYNMNNGERFETYVIEAPAGSGMIGLRGAAARKGLAGDMIIIASYAMVADEELARYTPQIVVLDQANRIKRHGPASS
ncbi:aspartate 1-decarboxylase [Desulfurivibrio alkaliphilus]|uniref:Aspartate 1-decarboxylase n=1 Tax=Desulfurivibrio alkaliphilus (strain DSM 19089 / UNIQEM U267 / AHT2) TaxID=589865 RepID=D6Z1H1_DESAT|nr:aspartate 1-decarboxylase [Desulfurivibrio alkaliphilus AHT 2]